jgi:hypothetical protein
MEWYQTIDHLVYWTVPPGFQRIGRAAVRSLIRELVPLKAEWRVVLQRNAGFHNMFAGRRCFIIGNGPSLNKQDLTYLDCEITIVMNHFYKHPILERWQPTFYCAADHPDYWTYHDIEAIKSGARRIHPRAYFVLLSMKPTVERFDMLPLEKTYYLKGDGPWIGWPSRRYSWDLTKLIPCAFTTVHMAMLVALYAGCSPIYLIGLDHDWLAHRSVEPHFYPTDPTAYGTIADLSMQPYKTMVEKTVQTWSAYEAIHAAASTRGIEIYNATAGGFLDVFPRVEFESLFPAAPRANA